MQSLERQLGHTVKFIRTDGGRIPWSGMDNLFPSATDLASGHNAIHTSTAWRGGEDETDTKGDARSDSPRQPSTENVLGGSHRLYQLADPADKDCRGEEDAVPVAIPQKTQAFEATSIWMRSVRTYTSRRSTQKQPHTPEGVERILVALPLNSTGFHILHVESRGRCIVVVYDSPTMGNEVRGKRKRGGVG